MRQPILAILLLSLIGACRSPHDPSFRVVDLTTEFSRAQQRPAGSFSVAVRGRPAIVAPAPGRITWILLLPRNGRFRASIALDGTAPVRFRIGVSDDRVYEKLLETTVSTPGAWTEVDVDLSAYAGRKWSVFYHPDAIAWQLTLSTDAVTGGAARGLWGAPQIVTDHDGALEYDRRLRSIRSAAP